MNVREDLLTDLVTTLYKDDARIKQLIVLVEAAYREGFEDLAGYEGSPEACELYWPNSNTFKQLQTLKE